MESVTLSIYGEEQGGAALWSETQNVAINAEGLYSVLIGSTLPEGVPAELFAKGEPRWLGVQFNRPSETEQARVLLVSVPYALKAGDAQMLGGRPASAYVLAPSATNADGKADANPGATGNSKPASTKAATNAAGQASAGTAGFIAEFFDTTTVVNSNIFHSGANIGVGTTTPLYAFDVFSPVAGPSAALRIGNATTDNRMRVESNQPYALGMKNGVGGTYAWMGATTAGDYQFSSQGGTPLATIMQGGNVGIGNTGPGSKLDVAGDINLTGNLRYQTTPVLQFPTVGGGSLNLALGAGAMQNSTNSGLQNTAIGSNSLKQNAGGSFNLALGASSLQSNTSGASNTAIGSQTLLNNLTGAGNTAIGQTALQQNTSGQNNTAVGFNTLVNNVSGSSNIAIGNGAAGNVNSGSSNNIHIGNTGLAGDNGVIKIGNVNQTSFFAAGIRGVQTGIGDAIPVVIDSAGQLGTVSSSARFKEDIQEMGDASRALLRLRPVTFRYRKPYADGSKPIQYGLIAEEVNEVFPELVAHSADGSIETVKYQVLDSLLLNEVQRQDRLITTQTEQIRSQQEEIRSLNERLARLEAIMTSGSNPGVR